MKRTAVLNVVGLTKPFLSRMPRLLRFAGERRVGTITPVLPAVTCTAQSTYLTGLTPSLHGSVANGWYDRALAEVHFWKQSNHLVSGRKLWEELRDAIPAFTCAKLFWWYNMYSSAEFSITPRPSYPADGRKVFDIYTSPMSLRPEIKRDLGEFPFRSFWGPAAGIESSRWIAASARWIEERKSPTLSLTYLPHLDYNLQRMGPNDAAIEKDLAEVDEVAGDLIAFYEQRHVEVVVLSEYGITQVDRPIHLNRIFREEGWIVIKEELGLEMIDCGASKVFAVADHQVAHVYLNDLSLISRVRARLEREPGIEVILDATAQEASGIHHHRGGDLVVVSDERSWFTYYYWMDDKIAPDFARTVDIHRKIGFDPAELFIDPAIPWPAINVAWFLLKKKLGLRGLLNVIPLDASLVRGSHGRIPKDPKDLPILIVNPSTEGFRPELPATDIYGILREVCLRQ